MVPLVPSHRGRLGAAAGEIWGTSMGSTNWSGRDRRGEVVRARQRRADGLARNGRWLPSGTDDGATTAEFAVVTMAAVGFAGLLVVILKSDVVRGILEDLVHRALSTGS